MKVRENILFCEKFLSDRRINIVVLRDNPFEHFVAQITGNETLTQLESRENLKFHFAGAEQLALSVVLANTNVSYCLWSCYQFIAPKIGITALPQIAGMKNYCVPKEIEKRFKHTIMDSGIFTLMYGAQAGRKDEAFLDQWYRLLVEFVLENALQSTIVEVDCQKILGVEAAWKYRERMKNDLPNNRQMNVFHFEDGIDGLKRLIDFSDYISLGISEWKNGGFEDWRDAVYRTVSFIKERKPEIDIHLLGTSDWRLLKQCGFCTTADATSYLNATRYHTLFGRKLPHSADDITDSRRSAFKHTIEELESLAGKEFTENMRYYYLKLSIAIDAYKERYQFLLGNQD